MIETPLLVCGTLSWQSQATEPCFSVHSVLALQPGQLDTGTMGN